MNRDLVLSILKKAPGTSKSGSTYSIDAAFRASLLLGQNGAQAAVQDIASLELDDSFLCIKDRDGSVSYLSYESIISFSVKVPKDPSKQRTGF